MSGIQGKVIAITGASSGIGEAAARELARRGAHVVLGARRTDRLKRLVAEITAAGGSARCRALDVTRLEDVQAFVAFAQAEYGRLDVLVNNAAITVFGSIADISPEDFKRCYTVDVDSIFMGCKAAIPLMAKSGGGSIVNFSSAAGNKVSPDLAAYNSAKAAVVTLTKSIALYCAREQNGVRVNSVQPARRDNRMNHAESVAIGRRRVRLWIQG